MQGPIENETMSGRFSRGVDFILSIDPAIIKNHERARINHLDFLDPGSFANEYLETPEERRGPYLAYLASLPHERKEKIEGMIKFLSDASTGN
jgi:hypothetical protein